MTEKDMAYVQSLSRRVLQNVGEVVVGKTKVVELALVALFSNGHLLVDDIPGVGKTMLAKSLARSLGCSFRRIQCTPDLLPADIIGSSVFNQKLMDFEFKSGPIMTQVLLVDEINRAIPRTQSALLEAMEERQITVEQGTMELPHPFLVLATQNPVELEGTFLLPEAQLDRFLLKVSLGYPSVEEDHSILSRFQQENPLQELEPVLSVEELSDIQRMCREVRVSEALRDYMIKLVHATREHHKVELGVSTRGMLNLFHAAQSLAALQGRSYVIPDDVKYLAPYVLGHRLVLEMESSWKGTQVENLCREIVDSVPVPVEESG